MGEMDVESRRAAEGGLGGAGRAARSPVCLDQEFAFVLTLVQSLQRGRLRRGVTFSSLLTLHTGLECYRTVNRENWAVVQL